jgi:hypothetical protein
VTYLDHVTLLEYTVLPMTTVDAVEAVQEGWIDRKLSALSRAIDARLRKRYTVPFTEPYPEAVCDWLARLVDPLILKKLGVDATDEQFVSIADDAKKAAEEIKEAADAQEGLFDLPLLDTADASAISKGAPLGYSEASPYVGMDVQESIGRDEDVDCYGSGDG